MDPTVLGAVVLALATLVALAVSVKALFWPAPANGNGTHDVTRREFEELKAYTYSSLNEIRDRLTDIALALARMGK